MKLHCKNSAVLGWWYLFVLRGGSLHVLHCLGTRELGLRHENVQLALLNAVVSFPPGFRQTSFRVGDGGRLGAPLDSNS